MIKKILFVGPASFNQCTWETRANYILPDLFSSAGPGARLFILTPPVPDFARESLASLCRNFSVSHIEADTLETPGDSISTRWKKAVKRAAQTIKPDVITNSLGSLRLGEAIAYGASQIGAKSVIRVAGDEIGSRLAMGTYSKQDARYKKDIATERAGFAGADAIIAMSPWERERIWNALGEESAKVRVCIRGVDVKRFCPNLLDYPKTQIRRFLYVGRKSAEKGYDIIEAAAQLVFQWAPEVEFLFVGDFEPVKIENRHYLGWIEAANLPDLYRSVDAFVLTSRTEGFPQVVTEAMATGLPCILSEHLFSGIFKHGEDALLPSLASADVAEQIVRLARDPSLAARLSSRSRVLAETGMDQNVWRKRYASILFGQSQPDRTVFDQLGEPRGVEMSELPITPRIAYILPRVFGIMGTQGSYGMAKAFSSMTPTMLISRKSVNPAALPIVTDEEGLTIHHKVDFSSPKVGREIAELLAGFRPDIVHFVNDHSWVNLLPFLRSSYPDARYVMDFQTPLLAEGDKRHVLQAAGQKQARNVDLVISLSSDIAQSWIPGYGGNLLVYPLGIMVDQINRRTDAIPASDALVRFIYVGQTHPKRKLPKLLELVAGLDEHLKKRFAMDIYGAGGGEEEIDAQIDLLGLKGTVTRNAPLPQDQLFALLPKYDCGIAWVPRETYDEAPSLKFLEYAAAKIAVIATDTTAHKRNIADGFQVPLFDESITSFSKAVQEVMAGNISAASIEKNYEAVQRYDFQWIARNILLPEYARKAQAESTGEASIDRLRLLFVTPRPLGLMATPGTYLSVEAYAEHCDVEVIAKARTSDDEIIVHAPRESIHVTLIDPQRANYADQVTSVVRAFRPDIVCLSSWPNWHVLSSALRREFPGLFISLEVKSPVITKNADRLVRDRIRWQREHSKLDAIIAPARGMVDTVIEKIERPFLQHRSIIDFSGIDKKQYVCDRVVCRKFVFSGSLAKLRQLDKFLRLFARLPRYILDSIEVDFFGDGPARGELMELSDSLGLKQTIRFLGAVPQKELFQRYKDYDAGIAWVPKELYDSAPSLKLIEYCAAGIVPLATSSRGHLLLETYGFAIDYFGEDDEQSFIHAMTELCTDGVPSNLLLGNITHAAKFDFRSVIETEILPFYREVMQEKKEGRRFTNLRAGSRQRPSSPAMPADPIKAWARQSIGELEIGELEMNPAKPKGKKGLAYERALHVRRMRRRIIQITGK